jgi:uncharacterized protein YuzE
VQKARENHAVAGLCNTALLCFGVCKGKIINNRLLKIPLESCNCRRKWYNNNSDKLSFEKRKENMKVYYDDEVDALYLKLGDDIPDGAIEIAEGVNLDTTSQDKIVSIEILNASKKMDLRTVLSYSLEFDKDLILNK